MAGPQRRKRILLVAAKLGYQTRVFAEAGTRLGYQIQLATDRCHHLNDPWGDGAVALDFRAEIHEVPGDFDGIVAVGDQPAEIASRIAAAKGLRFHPPHAVTAARNKHLARQRFAEAGMLVPGFERVRLDDADDYCPKRFPCVLKPLCLSASRGIIRADNLDEFRAAFTRIRRMLPSTEQYLQVEDFIPGQEFALEGIMTGGKLHTLAVFDKPDPLDGPFFEETIYVTPTRSGATGHQIIATVQDAVQALGLTDGPVHAEMRVNERGVWMLEVAARPIGGLCARALQFRSGRSLEELILRHAAGDDDASAEQLRLGGSGVMMIPIPRRGIYQSVRGVEQAQNIPGIESIEITAKEGQEMIPLPEGASYLGFIFAHAGDPMGAEAALRQAHALLEFNLAATLPQIR
jgi:biotin carboxylase